MLPGRVQQIGAKVSNKQPTLTLWLILSTRFLRCRVEQP